MRVWALVAVVCAEEALLDAHELREFMDKHKLAWMQHMHKEHDEGSTCGLCVKKVAGVVMKRAAEHLQDECTKSKSEPEVGDRMCRVMAKHEGETFGAMAVWVRPLEMAAMFCLGRGACASYEEAKGADEVPLEYHLAEARAVESLDLRSAVDPHFWQLEEEACAGKECEFMACVKGGTMAVMAHAAEQAQEDCLRATSDRVKAMCSWAHEHHAVAAGMLFAMVQPWKYAMGGCFARMHPALSRADWPEERETGAILGRAAARFKALVV